MEGQGWPAGLRRPLQEAKKKEDPRWPAGLLLTLDPAMSAGLTVVLLRSHRAAGIWLQTAGEEKSIKRGLIHKEK